jgi:hypothetical protein
MSDFIDLGVTAPAEESCAQVGNRSYDYYDRARAEARALINQLRRTLGPEPPGTRLSLKSHPHDFGTYLTIVCYFDGKDAASAAYAQRCDNECPLVWDEQARAELGLLHSEGGDQP